MSVTRVGGFSNHPLQTAFGMARWAGRLYQQWSEGRTHSDGLMGMGWCPHRVASDER
ncbi:MAG: hypothetical protein IID37_09880 [Planctomycetes bacterium]|nr:hypothetical protein [Planctomycetota bacterium]